MLYTVEIHAYDPDVASEVPLYFATAGFASEATDTPANTHFDDRLDQPATIVRDLFSAGKTSGRSRVSYGDLVLKNGDGALDALLNYGFDGRRVIVRRGDLGAAYPSGFDVVGEWTAQAVEATSRSITLKLRDRQYEVEVPLQSNFYTGGNTLPDGLEGVDDLQGLPKPRTFGKVRNVPAVCVNTARLIYQVNDGPIASLDAVYDRGIRLSSSLWAPANTAITGIASRAQACAFGNGRYVAVGQTGISSTTDGSTWTAATGDAVDDWRGVAYSDTLGVWVAVGSGVVRSTNGTTWTLQGTGDGAAVIWSGRLGLFVAVDIGGDIYTSPTGATWTARTSNTTADLNAICEGEGLLVAVGADSTVVTSTDGITWIVRTFSVGEDLYGVAFGYDSGGGPLFVAGGSIVGTGETSIALSHDGIDWTISRLDGVDDEFHAMAYGDGLFRAGTPQSLIYVSVNGVDWSPQTISFTDGDPGVLGLCNGDLGWLAVGGTSVVASRYAFSRLYDTYADAADLEDDTLAPAPGEVKVYLGGGYFRLGAPPDGLITADVTEGATAGDRTAAQVFAKMLSDPLGAPLVEFSSDDIDTLDAAFPYGVGFWSGLEDVRVSDMLDQLAASLGAWWGVDRDGVFRFQVLDEGPSGTPTFEVTANDIKGELERLPFTDEHKGIPRWKTRIRFDRNWSVQETDVAAGVSDARRADLAREYREAFTSEEVVRLRHPLAPDVAIDTLLTESIDALNLSSNQQDLYSTIRHRYRVRIPLTEETDLIDLNDLGTLTHARFGLSGGELVRVFHVEPDANAETLTLDLWR